MSIYELSNTDSPNNTFKRSVLSRDKVEILIIDHKIDGKGDLQIYLNSVGNSKNPASNHFPQKWNICKCNLESKYFEINRRIEVELSHISFHPRPHYTNPNLGRNTRIHFKNGTSINLPGEDKNKEFFTLISFLNEKSDGTLETTSIVQNFQPEVREEKSNQILNNEINNILNCDLETQEYKYFSNYVKSNLDLKKLLVSLISLENMTNYCVKIGKDSEGTKNLIESYNNEIGNSFLKYFDFDKNYTLVISKIDDAKEIKNRRRFFDVSCLNLICIGNLDFAVNADFVEANQIVIGYF
jgi:hypothetical protein